MTQLRYRRVLKGTSRDFVVENFTVDDTVPQCNWLQTVFHETAGDMNNRMLKPSKDQISQILVGTSPVMGVDSTLHKAAHVFKFDVEFLDGYDC